MAAKNIDKDTYKNIMMYTGTINLELIYIIRKTGC